MQNRPDNRIYAGFFVRLAAYIVDTVIVWAAMLIVRLPVWVTTISSPDNFLVFYGFNAWKETFSDKSGECRR